MNTIDWVTPLLKDFASRYDRVDVYWYRNSNCGLNAHIAVGNLQDEHHRAVLARTIASAARHLATCKDESATLVCTMGPTGACAIDGFYHADKDWKYVKCSTQE